MDAPAINQQSLKKIKRAISYIEDNLTKQELSAGTIADHCYCSKWHLHELFRWYTGYSLMNYARNRRLMDAACKLRDGRIDILDLAMEYQFESQQSFTRAFKKLFTVPPAKFKKHVKDPNLFEVLIKKPEQNLAQLDRTFEQMREQAAIQKPTIVEHADQRFWGLTSVHTANFFVDLDKKLEHTGRKAEIVKRALRFHKYYPTKLYTISNQSPNAEAGCQEETVGFLESDLYKIPRRFSVKEVNSGQFMEYTHYGYHKNLAETFRFIYGFHLPQSRFRFRDGSSTVSILDKNSVDGPNSRFKVLIPVQKI